MARKKLADYEQTLKWFALVLGILSTIAIVQNGYSYTMFISLPFCLIGVYWHGYTQTGN